MPAPRNQRVTCERLTPRRSASAAPVLKSRLRAEILAVVVTGMGANIAQRISLRNVKTSSGTPVVGRPLPGRGRRTGTPVPGLRGTWRSSAGGGGARRGRPSARALEPADGVWGHRKGAGRGAPEHCTGPQGEAERESARAGRRGLGASEARRARSARARDGPPDIFDPPPG